MRKLDTLQRIELAEGVEIQLRLAGPAVRGLAWMLDMAIKAGIAIVCWWGIMVLGSGLSIFAGEEIGTGVALGVLGLLLFLLDWGYSILFEVSRWRATPGKRSFGLQVAQTSGAPITIHQAVVRNMIRIIDLLPFGGTVGLVSCLLTRRFQRLGDLAADTVVVYARDELPASSVAEAAQRVRKIRPAVPLTREEQQAVLSYADRLPDWPEARQWELAEHASSLVRGRGEAATRRLLGVAQWIRTEG